MQPNLPGYYFDAEKNRYFKIQANHVAPTGAKYSRQAVQADKVVERVKRDDASMQRSKSATTVTRSNLLQHPLLSFDRRLGDLRKTARSIVGHYYANSLHGTDAFCASGISRSPALSPDSGCFAVDHDSGTLFGDFKWRTSNQIAQRGTQMFAFHRSESPFDDLYPCQQDTGKKPWRETRRADDDQAAYTLDNHSKVCRVHRVEKIVSIGSGMTIWVQGSRPDQIAHESRVRVGACSIGEFADRHDLVHEMAFYSRIQDIAVQPGGSSGYPSYTVALATASSLWIMDTSTWRYPMTEYSLSRQDGTTDVTKIHFKDHNILMAGTRSGRMLLCDIREPPSSSGTGGRSSAPTRIQHASAITNLRALPDGNAILLAGLGTTRIYDLRYTPSPSLKGHLPRTNSYRDSPAILGFSIPETRRTTQYGLGWAYDPELNLMISASTDYVSNHRVGVWGCSTGRMVQSPLNDHVFAAPVTCADVVRIRDGPKSILLGDGRGITEWNAQGTGKEDG